MSAHEDIGRPDSDNASGNTVCDGVAVPSMASLLATAADVLSLSAAREPQLTSDDVVRSLEAAVSGRLGRRDHRRGLIWTDRAMLALARHLVACGDSTGDPLRDTAGVIRRWVATVPASDLVAGLRAAARHHGWAQAGSGHDTSAGQDETGPASPGIASDRRPGGDGQDVLAVESVLAAAAEMLALYAGHSRYLTSDTVHDCLAAAVGECPGTGDHERAVTRTSQAMTALARFLVVTGQAADEGDSSAGSVIRGWTTRVTAPVLVEGVRQAAAHYAGQRVLADLDLIDTIPPVTASPDVLERIAGADRTGTPVTEPPGTGPVAPGLPFDRLAPPRRAPVGADAFLWRLAYTVHTGHRIDHNNSCHCGRAWPCPVAALAHRYFVIACQPRCEHNAGDPDTASGWPADADDLLIHAAAVVIKTPPPGIRRPPRLDARELLQVARQRRTARWRWLMAAGRWLGLLPPDAGRPAPVRVRWSPEREGRHPTVLATTAAVGPLLAAVMAGAPGTVIVLTSTARTLRPDGSEDHLQVSFDAIGRSLVRYQDRAGTWGAVGARPRPWTRKRDEPGADATVNPALVHRAVRQFLTMRGQRPTCVSWRPVRPLPPRAHGQP